MKLIREFMSFENANVITEAKENDKGSKDLYLRGVFIQAETRNLNGRIYPLVEIRNAVDDITKTINRGESVLGECDHPEKLTINLDRVSHVIEKMWMEGNAGHGSLRVLPTPHGNIIRTLVESGVKLGVSSRGSGDVDTQGIVSGFELITIDIVAKPSATQAVPNIVYESLYSPRGYIIEDLAMASVSDDRAKKFLAQEIKAFIEKLK